MRLSELGRFWRTVRHLKPIQFFGRAHFLWHRPRLDHAAAPPQRPLTDNWTAPAGREPSLVGPLRLRFLSAERALEDCGWDQPEVERLWRYNLHYFDDLNALGAASRRGWQRQLVSRWLADNPPPQGTGWEPYPLSLRVVNWVKWFLAGEAADAACLQSLAVQTRWLGRRLERHLLGNHLFANAKAMVFAGLFFDGDEARSWLDAGLAIIGQELPEQFLADGGHFERSTLYHALGLEDLLDLINVIRAQAPAESAARLLLPDLTRRANAMLHWLRCMSHPDGGIALFNDAADGIAPGNAELEAYADRLGVSAERPPAEGLTDLMPSGYVRAARGPAVALMDAAPIGPDYLVGHAHADTLAFELSLHGRRVVVNGGTSCYGLGTQRLRERGTGWHSTVQIGDADSSEVWSGFRVGRRARISARQLEGWVVNASHDGWRALPGAPVHSRCWTLDADALLVDDRIDGGRPSNGAAVAHFHLAPGLRLLAAGTSTWAVMSGDHELAQVVIETGSASIMPSQHAPRFGQLIPTQSLVVALLDGHARTRWRWSLNAHPLSH